VDEGVELKLHIPAPHARPGDRPTFDHIAIPAAGATRRPDVDAHEQDMRDLPYGMVRVLDADGRAVGPWATPPDPEFLRAGLRAMVQTRIFEDRMFRAHRQGKTSFFMKSTGEEAIGVAQSLTLAADDMCFPTYRVQGWLIARGYPIVDMMNQI
jgi:2-oxoisovalerate dehydrogenase E1 component alpha subunit